MSHFQKKSSRRKWRSKKALFLVTLFAAGSGFVLAQKLQAFEESEVYDERIAVYQEMRDSEELITEYHRAQNEYLNKKIKALVTAEDLSEIDKLPELLEDGTRGECPDNNVSTLCVARRMLMEFSAFEDVMQDRKSAFALETLQDLREGQSEGLKFSGAVPEATQNYDRLEEELNTAKDGLEMALSAYNELHMAYPLHKKYGELIATLETYRDGLSDIRKEIELYPETFWDVTTPECN